MRYFHLAKIAPLISLFIFVVVWMVIAQLSNWDPHVFPPPSTVLVSMGELIADGSLLKHTVASLFRFTAGFYLAVTIGVPFGIFLGLNRTASMLINPVIHFLRPISPLAWIPLAMLWFGIGDKPAVFLIFLASVFPIIVATTVAVRSINPTYFYVAVNFGFSRFERLGKIILPAIFPSILTALRLTASIAWIVVVAAEMIAVQSGLGYLILDARNGLRMDYVMDAMIVIGIIGLLLDNIMQRMGRIDSAAWGTYLR